jgi:hypothetical protein
MGLTTPDFFLSANNLPPKSTVVTSDGHQPCNNRLTTAAITMTRACPASWKVIKSSRCCGRRSSGPALEPAGNKRIALMASRSVVCIAGFVDGFGRSQRSAGAAGCRLRNASSVAWSFGADLSSKHNIRTAVLTLPSSNLDLTAAAKADDSS